MGALNQPTFNDRLPFALSAWKLWRDKKQTSIDTLIAGKRSLYKELFTQLGVYSPFFNYYFEVIDLPGDTTELRIHSNLSSSPNGASHHNEAFTINSALSFTMTLFKHKESNASAYTIADGTSLCSFIKECSLRPANDALSDDYFSSVHTVVNAVQAIMSLFSQKKALTDCAESIALIDQDILRLSKESIPDDVFTTLGAVLPVDSFSSLLSAIGIKNERTESEFMAVDLLETVALSDDDVNSYSIGWTLYHLTAIAGKDVSFELRVIDTNNPQYANRSKLLKLNKRDATKWFKDRHHQKCRFINPSPF